MKAQMIAASAASLLGSVAASHMAHQGFHVRRGGYGELTPSQDGVCTVYTTVTVYPKETPVAPVQSTVYVYPSPVAATSAPSKKPLPTGEVTTCPTPGTYTFPAKTITVTQTETVHAPTTTVVPAGTHSYGGVTTSVVTATTVTCPYATVKTSGSVTTSTIETTTYVCPSAGEYTIVPHTTTVVTETEKTIVYPTISTYVPGTYTHKATTVTVTKTSEVVVCPYEKSTEAPKPAPTKPAYSAPAIPSKPAEESKPAYSAPAVPSKPAEESKPAYSAPAHPSKPAEESKPAFSAPAYPSKPAEVSKPAYSAPAVPSKPAEESKPAYSAPVYPSKPAEVSKPAYSVPAVPSKPAYSAPAAAKPSQSSTPSNGGYGGRIVTNGNKWAITYTPYTEGGQCKSAGEVQTDIKKIAEMGFTTIRSYSTDCGVFENVAPACKANGLKMILGIFFEAGKGPFTDYANNQLEEIKSNAAKDTIAMIIVGNEALFNGYCTAEELGSYIDHVRQTLQGAGFPKDIAITTTEPVDVWQNKGSSLCSHIDVFAAQIHPYFTSSVTASFAGVFAKAQLELAAAVCPEAAGKGKFITEIGWPHSGNSNGAAVPGYSEQKEAISSIMETVGKESCLFSYQDDKWKAPGSFDVEQNFGCADAL